VLQGIHLALSTLVIHQAGLTWDQSQTGPLTLIQHFGSAATSPAKPRMPQGDPGYCYLKSNWADFLPRTSNLNPEQSMSYEFAYPPFFGQIHLNSQSWELLYALKEAKIIIESSGGFTTHADHTVPWRISLLLQRPDNRSHTRWINH
jgi:hypothetical protein